MNSWAQPGSSVATTNTAPVSTNPGLERVSVISTKTIVHTFKIELETMQEDPHGEEDPFDVSLPLNALAMEHAILGIHEISSPHVNADKGGRLVAHFRSRLVEEFSDQLCQT